MRDRLWITWEHHRRSVELSEAVGASLVVLALNGPRWVRHPLAMVSTVVALVVRRPRVLFVQSPSLVLNALALLLAPLFRFRLVVDAHNAGVYQFDEGAPPRRWLYRWLHRHSDLVIVTNAALARIVESHGGRSIEIVDPRPRIRVSATTEHGGLSRVLFVCSFASDEPFNEVIEAAARLGDSVKVLVTGAYERSRAKITAEIPDNLTFTGFVPDAEYEALLGSCSVVMDLTRHPDCLVCGSYEAISAGKPLILSDTPVNRALYTSGAVFCDNSVNGIHSGMIEALNRREELAAAVPAMADRLDALIAIQLRELERVLQSDCRPGGRPQG